MGDHAVDEVVGFRDVCDAGEVGLAVVDVAVA
jgi:hypothetical protein